MSRRSLRKATNASNNTVDTIDNKEEEDVVVSCDIGNYLNGKKCEVCPKGYYCVGDNEKKPCPAGKYLPKVGGESEESCLSCEDYYWSDAGSSMCGKIKIRQWYSHWNNDNVMDRACSRSTYKWFDADSTVKCDNATFGDSAIGLGKGCGAPCGHITGEGNSYNINCKSLPCVISAGSDRQIRLTANGKMECFGKSWGIEKEWSDCGNGNEVIKWK